MRAARAGPAVPDPAQPVAPEFGGMVAQADAANRDGVKHDEIVTLAVQARYIAEDVQTCLLSPRLFARSSPGVASLGLAVEHLARAVEALAEAVGADAVAGSAPGRR